jgi:hypothetical protein
MTVLHQGTRVRRVQRHGHPHNTGPFPANMASRAMLLEWLPQAVQTGTRGAAAYAHFLDMPHEQARQAMTTDDIATLRLLYVRSQWAKSKKRRRALHAPSAQDSPTETVTKMRFFLPAQYKPVLDALVEALEPSRRGAVFAGKSPKKRSANKGS